MQRLDARQAFAGITGVRVLSSSPGWICLGIAPDLSLKDRVVRFLKSQMDFVLSAELSEQLAMAMDELLTNAIEHGCKIEPHCEVEISYVKTARIVLFQTRDAGPGFSIEELPHAAVSNPPNDPLRHADIRMRNGLRPGGFGIMLAREVADELVYNENGNEVFLIKYL
jgi:anti-sigma regulatory factor (Ser/Thr protein kinase)